MGFIKPAYTRAEVNSAGQLLRIDNAEPASYEWAVEVINNWRAAHLYPINTFQATLRSRVQSVEDNVIVAQRLKRAPSVLAKLRRFETMNLAQMQDIAGVRAIFTSVKGVRELQTRYLIGRFSHKLKKINDYILNPKPDGYRSVHMIYEYQNRLLPDYNGMCIELQIRTRKQHAWATAVETMGTFTGQALKSGMGDGEVRKFFTHASAAIALTEQGPSVPGYETFSLPNIIKELRKYNQKIHLLDKLKLFSVAADNIAQSPGIGIYNLIVLDSTNRTVSIKPFTKSRLSQATDEYSKIERDNINGGTLEAVLVAVGSIKQLRKAYPNFFLDTSRFISIIEAMMHQVR